MPETIFIYKVEAQLWKARGVPFLPAIPFLAGCLLDPPPCPRHLPATSLLGQGPRQCSPAQPGLAPISSRASTPNALSRAVNCGFFSEARGMVAVVLRGEGREDRNPRGKPQFWENQGQTCAGHLLLTSFLWTAVPLSAPSVTRAVVPMSHRGHRSCQGAELQPGPAGAPVQGFPHCWFSWCVSPGPQARPCLSLRYHQLRAQGPGCSAGETGARSTVPWES